MLVTAKRKTHAAMHKTATVAEWHRTRGRHEIFAKGKTVPLTKLSLIIREMTNDSRFRVATNPVSNPVMYAVEPFSRHPPLAHVLRTVASEATYMSYTMYQSSLIAFAGVLLAGGAALTTDARIRLVRDHRRKHVVPTQN